MAATSTAARTSNAGKLTSGLASVAGLALPPTPGDRAHVWHQYTVRVLPGAPVGRDEFCQRLSQAGVGHGVYYPKLMHDHPCYAGHPQIMTDSTPAAQAMTGQVVSLPVHPGLSPADRDMIVESVRAAVRG